jgi:sensor histidine kinase regulating citrate/malate metabolism
MQKEALENIESLNIAMRSQRHDFLNHIQVVYSLVEMKEYEEVTNYLNEVYGSIELLNNFIKTEDAAINALLRAKAFDAKRKGVEYKLNILSNLHGLEIPSWEICRCIGNLIDNAVFAAKDYSGEKSVSIYIRELISEFEFTVENSGEVIPEEIITKIFNAGFTTKRELGEGIGLYNVKQIVEGYGGNVSVVSKDNKTCFKIRLPKVLNSKNDISNI